MIMRVYGTAKTLHPRDAGFDEAATHFPPALGARQFYDMTIEMLQTSCGFAVPFFDYAGERDVLVRWTEDKGQSGIETYWDTRNRETIDGMPTHILKDTPNA